MRKKRKLAQDWRWGKWKPKTNIVGFVFNQQHIGKMIEKQAQKERQIIYGATAMNVQLEPIFRRLTSDYDIYSRNPRGSANKTQRLLDKNIAGQDDFFAKRARYQKTWRVMHEGLDSERGTEDDVVIVDYTKKPKAVDTVKREGILYESLASIERGKEKTLKDPGAEYRHEKDARDLGRIGAQKAWRKLEKRW